MGHVHPARALTSDESVALSLAGTRMGCGGSKDGEGGAPANRKGSFFGPSVPPLEARVMTWYTMHPEPYLREVKALS